MMDCLAVLTTIKKYLLSVKVIMIRDIHRDAIKCAPHFWRLRARS